jgi:hypothetical protein
MKNGTLRVVIDNHDSAGETRLLRLGGIFK